MSIRVVPGISSLTLAELFERPKESAMVIARLAVMYAGQFRADSLIADAQCSGNRDSFTPSIIEPMFGKELPLAATDVAQQMIDDLTENLRTQFDAMVTDGRLQRVEFDALGNISDFTLEVDIK